MSSLIRRIQRSIERKTHYEGRGSKLGVPVLYRQKKDKKYRSPEERVEIRKKRLATFKAAVKAHHPSKLRPRVNRVRDGLPRRIRRS